MINVFIQYVICYFIILEYTQPHYPNVFKYKIFYANRQISKQFFHI